MSTIDVLTKLKKTKKFLYLSLILVILIVLSSCGANTGGAATSIATESEGGISKPVNLDWDKFMRNPDDYIGTVVTFSGKVMNADPADYFSIEMNGDAFKMLIVYYDSSQTGGRVLYNDRATVVGEWKGLNKYSDPVILASKISIK